MCSEAAKAVGKDSAWPRPIPLAVTLVVHLALLALFLTREPRRSTPEPAGLALFDIASAATSPPTASEPRPDTPAEPMPVVPAVISVAAPQIATATAPTATSAGACDLTAPVQAALRLNGEVRAALGRVPRETRSVANAMVIWNAGWLDPDQTLDAPARELIRASITTILASASESCRLQPQGGPRLLIVPGDGETIVLALGSGVWKWQDLLDTAGPPAPNAIRPEW